MIHTIYLFLFTIFLISGMASPQAAEGLTSYIDDDNRFILNGEPFFPLGLYVVQCTNGSYAAELDEIANSPFDTMMNYSVNQCGIDATDTQILDYLDQLESRNLNLIFSLAEYFDGVQSATATWAFTAAQNGNYNVYAWWNAGSNRATDAPYTVNYDGGSQTIRVNQEINGSQWNLLGTFPFVSSTSGLIVLGNDADEFVMADAIRIEGAGAAGADIIMDEELATFASTWTCVTGKPQSYDEDHCWHAKFFDDIGTMTHKVNTFKTHSAVISWYLNDERDPATYLTQLEERYAIIRGLDVNHPVWSVHWNTDWLIQEVHTTDIVGVDPYPIGNHQITLVSQMADAANASGKPLWLVPQIFSWTDYPGDPRAATGYPPTKEEMRAMTYLAVNHGAKGLIYYSYFNIVDDPDYATRWPQIKEIAGEIDQLRPVFLSTYQTNDDDIVCDNADIDFKLMREGDTYYLFAVNTKEEEITGVSFEINLTQKPVEFETLFEGGRQISVTDGNVTDDFGVYEVHVYYWEEPESGGGEGGGSGGGGCFIATAAFGSYVDPHVQVLRDFRDKCLLTNMPGRWFVGMYNTYGPFWADLLNVHPIYKPFARLALMPVVGISYFVLNTSLATKLLTGFLLLGFIPICLLHIHGRSVTSE